MSDYYDCIFSTLNDDMSYERGIIGSLGLVVHQSPDEEVLVKFIRRETIYSNHYYTIHIHRLVDDYYLVHSNCEYNYYGIGLPVDKESIKLNPCTYYICDQLDGLVYLIRKVCGIGG